VHVVLLDDLQRDASAVYRGILEFLGLDVTFEPSFAVANPAKTIRSHRLNRFLFNPPKFLRSLYHALPASIREASTRKPLDWLKRKNTKQGYRAAMNPELRKELEEEFEPEIRELEAVLGRKLTSWLPGKKGR
jgi:hypothetical protein